MSVKKGPWGGVSRFCLEKTVIFCEMPFCGRRCQMLGKIVGGVHVRFKSAVWGMGRMGSAGPGWRRLPVRGGPFWGAWIYLFPARSGTPLPVEKMAPGSIFGILRLQARRGRFGDSVGLPPGVPISDDARFERVGTKKRAWWRGALWQGFVTFWRA